MKTWQVIKDIGKHKQGPIMSKRFTETDDPLIISNRFNEYFVNIGGKSESIWQMKLKCSPKVMKNI